MSHIHIPDGVLPLWIILVGWVVTGLLLYGAASRIRRDELARRLPLLGVISALMVIAMTVEIAPIAYHFNMTVVAGIVLGPGLGFLAAFIVDLILALVGHGGITVVGLNTLVVGTEIALGYYVFMGLRRLLGHRVGPGVLAGLATVPALVLSTSLMVGIVAASNVNPGWQAPSAPVEPGTLAFRNPFGRGVLSFELGPQGEAPSQRPVDVWTFVRLVFFLGLFGWTLESFLNAVIIRYVARVRPDLVEL